MSGGHTLRQRVRHQLMAAGTWVEREQLDSLTALTTVLEDTLADMVIAREIEHQRGAGYRMPGGPMVRMAMAELVAEPALRRSVKGRRVPGPDGVRRLVLGIAERRRLSGDAVDSVVSYCIELPPTDAAGIGGQVEGVLRLVDQHLAITAETVSTSSGATA